ncbi:MAG: aminotransferase class V-fold PLP-dependent enzyme [Gemmatimonadota bacterium]|nr:aminotransferase class V-fold PLP-dependent enzyme [Gemmatimonadota bacterium]
MTTRRSFLGAVGMPAVAAVAGVPFLRPRVAAGARLREVLAERHLTPAVAAEDEEFWGEVARAFTVDRSLVNLNNGGVSPAPAFVQEAERRHLAYSHLAPTYTMWRVLEPQREGVRQRLAREWGVDAEEIALTRNASEGLQTCQLGFDLRPGDEVLTTDQDYPRMLTTFRQRERREGIALRQIPLPVPAEDPDEVVRRFEAAITPRTRLILACHVINLTGQILPVRGIVAMARRRGIPVIVDGAHALAHFPFRLSDLDCDYYATSLHKWLFAPHGTGLLYVRRERITDLWPLMAAGPELDGDIRKFEEIGTHPAAGFLAVAEALTFHQALGPERKAARLVHLRDRWARRLRELPRVRLHTSLEPGLAGGFATVEIEGVEPGALASWLWARHRIIVTPIVHRDFRGIRVSPSVYTMHEEIDRFADAMERVAREGLPA